jgi:hypothetical protein
MNSRATMRLHSLFLVSFLSIAANACGGSVAVDPAHDTSAPSATSVESLRERWNAAAATVQLAPSLHGFSFEWTATAFPCPTFRGGSPDAYEAFATILVRFFATGDNLAFAKANHLLTARFSDGLASSSGGTTYSLQEMTAELSAPSWSTLVTASTASALGAYCGDVDCAGYTGH